jgi:hypothetical protein
VVTVVVFMKFVSKSGHEVAKSQVSVVQQVDHAQDVEAQSTARNALAAAKTIFLDDSAYTGVNPASLAGVEPALQYTDGPSPAVGTVSVASTAEAVGLAVHSSSGTCFYVRDDIATGTTFGSGTVCTGQAALTAATAASW